jgi:lipid A 3-O-deacylase
LHRYRFVQQSRIRRLTSLPLHGLHDADFGGRSPMRRILAAIASLVTLGTAGAAPAQDMTPVWWLDELRGGLSFHSVDKAGPNPLFGLIDTSRGIDVNAEVLFNPFDLGDLSFLGEFRPHIGATINTGALESMIYAGLSWTFHPFDGPVFIEASLGGSINNGATIGAVAPARNLGCNILFRESVSLGFDITENASVMLTAEHASHAGLCSVAANEGLSNLGIRFGYSF